MRSCYVEEKMEQKGSGRIKSQNKKVRLSSNSPKIERVLLAGDSNSCVLAIPEVFGMRENLTLYQRRFPKYQL
jgi:hypothetical protein